MSFNLVFDNLKKLREDAEYILRFVREHEEKEEPKAPSNSGDVPSSPAVGRGRIRYYSVQPEDSAFISEKVRPIGKAITELQGLLMPGNGLVTKDDLRNYEPFSGPVEKARQSFATAYDVINSVVQGLPDDGSFYSYMTDLHRDILYLERRVLEADALSLDAPNVQDSYVQRAVQSGLAKIEDEKTRVRQKIFIRADPDGKNLLHDLLNFADRELDRSVGHLMYLAGFDYEIYDRLKGNLDILVYHTTEKLAILVETTKAQPSKSKVDQVIARKKEYAEYFEEILGKNPRIHPLLVTTNEQSKLHDEARADAMQNEISIFTRKQVEELVNLLKKGKLNRRKVVDMISKNIPT